MVIAKASMEFNNILDINEYYRLVFFFKYPRFSLLCMGLMLNFTLFFNPTYFLSYLLALFIVFFAFKNPRFGGKLR